MICPNCLVDLENFKREIVPDEGVRYRCPQCKETAPQRYVDDYSKYPPLIFFCAGLGGHGRNSYLASLFRELDRIGEKWLDFSYTPLEEDRLLNIRSKQHFLEDGKVPSSERKLLSKPAIVRLSGVPQLGNCHLIIYDATLDGELTGLEYKHLKGFMLRNRVHLIFFCLQDLQSSTELTDMLNRSVQELTKLGAKPSDYKLLIVLTKGDRLLKVQDLPEALSAYLKGEERYIDIEKTARNETDPAEELSGVLESWLGNRRETMNFIRRAGAEFGQVKYTITSALGGEPDEEGNLLKSAQPKVMSPLLKAWKMQMPTLKQVVRRHRQQKVGRVVGDSLSEVGVGILGGILGLIEGAIWGMVLWLLAGSLEAWVKNYSLTEGLKLSVEIGIWGAVWGSLIWMVAGSIDGSSRSGGRIRNGVRLNALTGLILNGAIGGLIWGIVLTSILAIRGESAINFSSFLDNSIPGSVAGLRLGVLMGGLIGMISKVRNYEQFEILPGIIWAFITGAIASSLAFMLWKSEVLITYIIWCVAVILIFTMWTLVRKNNG